MNNNFDFYGEYYKFDKRLVLGLTHRKSKHFINSLELDYDPARIHENLFIPGLIARWCGEFRVTNDITVKPKLTIVKDLTLSAYWTYKFSKNLKILWSEDFYLRKKPEEMMNFGIMFEWTL
jgi:hypothetical protein